MKFLAILKDSLREALDTKVFYVMVGLSLLVVLLVGSIGYRPASVEEEAHRLIEQMNWMLALSARRTNRGPAPRWHVKDFQQTNPGAAPWQTGYRFLLVVEYSNDQQVEEARRMRKMAVDYMQRGLRQGFYYLKNLQVAEAEPQGPKELRYRVSSESPETVRPQDWPHYPVFLFTLPMRFWQIPIIRYVQIWESWIINWIGAAIALLISTIITAFFIPNMLRKGTVDLLIVKPISRPLLLLYKYIGGLTFIFLNTVVVVAGIWLVLGLRTNLWGTGFLLSIPVLTFQFAMYYAVSTLFAVLSRSPIVAILMTCLFWFVFAFLIGYGYYWIDKTRNDREMIAAPLEQLGEEKAPTENVPQKAFPDGVYATADIIHFLTPHLKDLDTLTDKWILDDVTTPESPQRQRADKLYANFHWTEALAVTSLYIVALLAVSCWWFARKDY